MYMKKKIKKKCSPYEKKRKIIDQNDIPERNKSWVKKTSSLTL